MKDWCRTNTILQVHCCGCLVWKIWNIKHSFNLTSNMKRSSQIMPKKSFFVMMTSSITSQAGLKIGPLCSFINEIITFFMISKQRAKILSLNFLCICFIRLLLQLYEYIFMTSLMTSPGHKIGQILKLIYLRQYLNYNVDQKLKMSEMLMAIFLVYSTSGITSGKKSLSRAQNGGHFENFEILNTASIWPQVWQNRPKLCQKCFLWWWRHRWRHRVASKFLSVFMFRRGWLREQIERAMSRQ